MCLCVSVCLCGKPPFLGVVYGLVAAAFLRSAASEQHIPEIGSEEEKSECVKGGEEERGRLLLGGGVG